MSIITRWKRELILAAIIFIISTFSFGLGYLANRELNHAPIIIEKWGTTGLFERLPVE